MRINNTKEVGVMSQVEFVGCLAVYGVVFIGGLIALIKPIISLNVNIQRLTDSIDSLTDDSKELKKEVNKHEDILKDHETRLTVIEKARDQ